MNRRTAILMIAAAAIGLLYVIDAGYRSWVEEPTQQLEAQLSAAEDELAELNAEQVAGRRLTGQLDDYAARALPYDPNLARSHYREWLLQRVERFEMKSASVNAESPRPVELRGRLDRGEQRRVGHTLRLTLRARTTLPRLVDFLHDFQSSAQLHKVLSFSLNPLGNGSELDLTMVIEALSLEAAERSDSLSDWVHAGESHTPRSGYAALVQRNIFARGFSQSLAEVRLRAITRNRDGTQEAWFAVGSPPETQTVAVGQSLELPLHSVEVEQVEAERVEIHVNGLPVWVELGQTLGQVLDPNGTIERDKRDTEFTDESSTESSEG